MTAIRSGSVVFENVTKQFADFTALPGLSLTVEPGTLVTLLGPSGCGKPPPCACWPVWSTRPRGAF